MRKVALRGLFAHKGRLVATLLAVALGVAFIGGVRVLTDTMNSSFDDLFATAYEGTDAVVRSSQTIEAADFGEEEQRADVDASLLPTVEAAKDVAAAEGQIQGFVQIIDKDGDALGADGFGPPSFGANWATVPQLNSWKLTDGAAPTADNQVVIDAATAKTTKYHVGDTVPIQSKQGLGEYELTGIARFGSSDSPAGATYALFTTEEAQAVAGLPGKFTNISVVADEGVSQTTLVKDLKTALDGDNDVEVLTGEEITEESQSDLKKQLSFFTIFLTVFAVIAVVVGCFVIYNSFSIVVAQRTREMALLRAIGASRKQVRRAVLAEALVTGVVGSVLGFLLGLLIASALTSVMDIEGSLSVLPSAIIVALVCGIVVTLVSALVPARRASKVPPVAAMREVAIDTSGRSRGRFIVGLAMMALGVVAVVLGARDYEIGTVGLGFALAFLGTIVAGPGLAGPVSEVVGWPLRKLRGVTGGLAQENAGRNPKRSAVTAYALMIGVGVMAFMLVLRSSMVDSFDKILDESFAADFFITSGGFGELGMPPDLAEAVAADPDVETAVPLRQTQAVIDDGAVSVTGTTPTAFDMFGFNVSQGSDELGDGQVVVLDSEARKKNLAVGSTVDLEFLNTGDTTLTVAGIYKDTEANSLGDFVIGLDQYSAVVPGSTDSMVLVKLKDGVSTEKAQSHLEDVVKPFGTAKVQTADDYKELISKSLDQLLLMIMGLLFLAFIIAMVGIANTIALSVLERTRELGLLRAVGMSRRQLRATIRWESVIIAVFGASLGLLIGLLGGWGVVKALGDEGIEVLTIPVLWLVVLTLVTGLIGLIAALWPAWRAGRLKVLDAIHTE